MRRKSNATTKRKIKRSRKSKHTNRDVKRETPQTGTSDSSKQSRTKQREKKITCPYCNQNIDFSSAIKYTEHLWFYWCACSVTARPLRLKHALKYQQEKP